MRALRIGGSLCIAYLSIGIALASFRYVTGNPGHYDELFRTKYVSHLGVVWLHGVAGTLALAIGPLQFWPGLRLRHRTVHRTLGLVYLLCIVCAGLHGLDMSLQAYGGQSSRLGFTVLDFLWLATAWHAWNTARQHRFAAHRTWMLRNFALTFGAATTRLYLAWLQDWGLSFDTIYPVVTWLGWIPNLLLVEVYLCPPAGRNKAAEVSRSA